MACVRVTDYKAQQLTNECHVSLQLGGYFSIENEVVGGRRPDVADDDDGKITVAAAGGPTLKLN